ncbi:MAG: YeeE/YedE family protein [Alphaproteobacteria bacterium]|nr:YeeE/YedE family protein [Alphaproteobacteria bacterium]NNF24279.1 YeeE/YedE family protein [Paracoccaceae bacterium]
MIFELYDLNVSPMLLAVVFGAVIGLLFGAAAQISRFCLRRGLVAGPDRRAALGVWLFALFVATVATQLAASFGWIDLSGHRFAAASVPLGAAVIGGLAFGAGMVLTRGCVSRLTVLGGSGNLRALFVLLVFAVVAHATLKGVLAPLRVSAGSLTVDLGSAATAHGLPGGAALWTAVLGALCLGLVLRSGAALRHLALAGVIGVLVPLGWFGTGVFLYDDFDPIALETLSFTAPWADTLFWSIASTSIPAGFGTGLLAGVIVGAAVSAFIRRETELVSFESPAQTLRYLAGGALMGFGGVLAGGCTVGAGLSGFSSLSVAAGLALLSMMAGAVLTDRAVDRPRRGTVAGFATPAE